VMDGTRHLLFAAVAGFSTRFLKHGSLTDMFHSIRPNNVVPMLSVARHNLDLLKYLVGQVLESQRKRFATLQNFFPHAKREDWRLEVAGQRVQVIKHGRRELG